MDYPSSPSSSSAHSSLTEYPQSAENSSEEAYSTESSVNSSPKNPQHAYITSPSSTNYYSYSPPPTPPPPPPPPLADRRRSSPPRLEGPRRERARRLDLSYYEELATFMRRARCVRYYLAWNACMDEALRTGQDYQLMCASASRLFRECIRHF